MFTQIKNLIRKIERLAIRINVHIDINILNFPSAGKKQKGKKGKRK